MIQNSWSTLPDNPGHEKYFTDGKESVEFKHFVDSLKNSGESNAHIADAVREYLANEIDLGISRDSLAYNYYKMAWEDVPVFESLALFRSNMLTAECGFTSYLLAKLYDYSGFKAYVYKCGFNERLTRHQFVLVEIDDKLIVQDAFYNITITDSSGSHKDFFSMLAEIKQGDFGNISIDHAPVKCDLWLDSLAQADSLVRLVPDFVGLLNTGSMQNENHRIKFELVRSFTDFIQPSLEKMKPLLQAEGLSENYLSVYLKPLQVRDNRGARAEKLEFQIEKVIGKPVVNHPLNQHR